MTVPVLVLVKQLAPRELPALARHLISLGSEDRRLRFGCGIHDPAIRQYVERIDLRSDAAFGVLDDELRIVGAAHLARGDAQAELGISVLPAHRGRGIGTALLERACVHARNWGVRELLMHCLAENGAMMHIARKQGMAVAQLSGDADAWLKLPPPDESSRMQALLEQGVAVVDHEMKRHLRGRVES